MSKSLSKSKISSIEEPKTQSMQDISIFRKSSQDRASTVLGGIKQVNTKEVKRYFDDTYGSPPKPLSALNII